MQLVLYKLPHNLILTSACTLLYHYLTVTLVQTTKIQYVIQSSGLWCHIIEPAVSDISKDHCAFIVKALQSFKISGTTYLMTGCYSPQTLNIVSSTAMRTTYHKYHIILLSKQTYTVTYRHYHCYIAYYSRDLCLSKVPVLIQTSMDHWRNIHCNILI